MPQHHLLLSLALLNSSTHLHMHAFQPFHSLTSSPIIQRQHNRKRRHIILRANDKDEYLSVVDEAWSRFFKKSCSDGEVKDEYLRMALAAWDGASSDDVTADNKDGAGSEVKRDSSINSIDNSKLSNKIEDTAKKKKDSNNSMMDLAVSNLFNLWAKNDGPQKVTGNNSIDSISDDAESIPYGLRVGPNNRFSSGANSNNDGKINGSSNSSESIPYGLRVGVSKGSKATISTQKEPYFIKDKSVQKTAASDVGLDKSSINGIPNNSNPFKNNPAIKGTEKSTINGAGSDNTSGKETKSAAKSQPDISVNLKIDARKSVGSGVNESLVGKTGSTDIKDSATRSAGSKEMPKKGTVIAQSSKSVFPARSFLNALKDTPKKITERQINGDISNSDKRGGLNANITIGKSTDIEVVSKVNPLKGASPKSTQASKHSDIGNAPILSAPKKMPLLARTFLNSLNALNEEQPTKTRDEKSVPKSHGDRKTLSLKAQKPKRENKKTRPQSLSIDSIGKSRAVPGEVIDFEKESKSREEQENWIAEQNRLVQERQNARKQDRSKTTIPGQAARKKESSTVERGEVVSVDFDKEMKSRQDQENWIAEQNRLVQERQNAQRQHQSKTDVSVNKQSDYGKEDDIEEYTTLPENEREYYSINGDTNGIGSKSSDIEGQVSIDFAKESKLREEQETWIVEQNRLVQERQNARQQIPDRSKVTMKVGSPLGKKPLSKVEMKERDTLKARQSEDTTKRDVSIDNMRSNISSGLKQSENDEIERLQQPSSIDGNVGIPFSSSDGYFTEDLETNFMSDLETNFMSEVGDEENSLNLDANVSTSDYDQHDHDDYCSKLNMNELEKPSYDLSEKSSYADLIDVERLLETIDDASLPILHIGARIQSNFIGPTHQGCLILLKDNGESGYNVLPCTAKRPWTLSEIKQNSISNEQQISEEEVQMQARMMVKYFEVEYHCYQKVDEVKQLRILQRRQAEADKEKTGEAKIEANDLDGSFDIYEVAVPKLLGIYQDDGHNDQEDRDVWGQSLGKEREWMVYTGGGFDGTETTLDLHLNTSQDGSNHHLHNVQIALNLPESFKFGEVMDAVTRSLVENIVFLTSCNIVHRNINFSNLNCDCLNRRLQLINFGGAVDLDPKEGKRIGLDTPSTNDAIPGSIANSFAEDTCATAMVICQLLFNLMDDVSRDSFQAQIKAASYDLDAWLKSQIENTGNQLTPEDIPALEYLGERRGMWGLLKRMIQPNPMKRKLAADLLKELKEIFGLRDETVQWTDDLIVKVATEETYLETLIDRFGSSDDINEARTTSLDDEDVPNDISVQSPELATFALDPSSDQQEDDSRGPQTKAKPSSSSKRDVYYDITRSKLTSKYPMSKPSALSSLLPKVRRASPPATAAEIAAVQQTSNVYDITRASLGTANPYARVLPMKNERQLPKGTTKHDRNAISHSDDDVVAADATPPSIDPVVGRISLGKIDEVRRWVLSYLPRLQNQDLQVYIKRLISDGFDSKEMLRELSDDDLVFMKKGHKRVLTRKLEVERKLDLELDSSSRRRIEILVGANKRMNRINGGVLSAPLASSSQPLAYDVFEAEAQKIEEELPPLRSKLSIPMRKLSDALVSDPGVTDDDNRFDKRSERSSAIGKRSVAKLKAELDWEGS